MKISEEMVLVLAKQWAERMASDRAAAKGKMGTLVALHEIQRPARYEGEQRNSYPLLVGEIQEFSDVLDIVARTSYHVEIALTPLGFFADQIMEDDVWEHCPERLVFEAAKAEAGEAGAI